MATIQNFHGRSFMQSPVRTYDITSTTAERIGSFVYYFSFGTDGRMFVLHTLGSAIVGWAQFDGDIMVQEASTNLALQPFLDNMNGRNPSSTKAIAYFMGGDDLMIGSRARDDMVGLGGADTLNGGGGSDHLAGGAGADRLTGGAGTDRLTGGADADHFVFNQTSDGGDKITDFVHGLDQIDLSGAAFGFSGPLVDGVSFVRDGAATAATATVLYDSATGILSFDADGAGAGLAVTLATLTNLAGLTVADVLIF